MHTKGNDERLRTRINGAQFEMKMAASEAPIYRRLAGSLSAGFFIMKKFNYFYKTTNIINEKFYYGVHSSDKDNDNYLGSGKLLLKAIKKYGRENFKREIIQFFDSFDDALSLLNIDMYILLNMN